MSKHTTQGHIPTWVAVLAVVAAYLLAAYFDNEVPEQPAVTQGETR